MTPALSLEALGIGGAEAMVGHMRMALMYENASPYISIGNIFFSTIYICPSYAQTCANIPCNCRSPRVPPNCT